MRFDRAALREVVSISDELGVLSFYVTVDPRADPGSRPAWRIKFANDLGELRRRAEADPERARRTAVLKRLDGLERDFHALLDPSRPGVGRVLFAPVGRDEARTFSFQLPVADQMVLETTAYVRPLVNTVETAPPAGIVVVSRDGTRVVDYRYGQAEDLGGMRFEIASDDWRDPGGPSRTDYPSHGTPYRDRFEKRVADNVARLTREAGQRVAEEAANRGWTAIVVLGDPPLGEILAGELNGDVIQLGSVAEPGSPTKLVERVRPQLEQARTRLGALLAGQARDGALSGGRGSLGLADTLGALNDSRVAQLLLDESREWSGRCAADGLLYPPYATPPGNPEITEEPRMGERMIERALDIDAEVIVLDGAAAEALADVDGVGAILRW
ncbi:VLRF1 family aeRF1-type release factor [Streptosporangium sandarakinum]|uniref:Uncharacterized protein n=1 Tax=Streptosporangium sandarakinum TaxID=1260955 RepID=A0A852VBH1_9ACTN|nr:VLRF1 family aeRF1-type release factor [Streptosporangium sandarakinum]NYF43475.1 hypothetical protein [Streptosporangium sandarakinum]